MKSPIAFLRVLVQDMGERCHVSTHRDLKTISARFEHEGWSFLTITLSGFGSDFQKGLEQGRVDPDMFPGFRRHAGLPRFLGGFLDLVFDRQNGVLLSTPSHVAIQAIRQITLAFGKVQLPCSPARTQAAFDGYVECEQAVRAADASRDGQLLADFSRVSRVLYAETFTRVDFRIYNGEVLPKHGPGATADRLTANRKYAQSVWTDRLEEVFPAVDFALPNHGWYQSALEFEHLEPGRELPVRVISVPKTLKTPRIIAIEPTCMQYMQQAILEALTEEGRRDELLWSLLGWDDQQPNGRLARLGSLNGELATLDLKDASDRVSNQLVRTLVEPHPWLGKAVDATRSRKADVPGHGVIRLAKFASMGSALCFPFEAMVFLTAIVIAWERVHSTRSSRKTLSRLVGKVRVFGDDIIVPRDIADEVIVVLEALGLKVNTSKSFLNSKFRESCGQDWYDGHNVNVVRVRRPFPESPRHVQEIVSTVSLRNQLYWVGAERSVEYLDATLERVLHPYPFVSTNSPVLGRHTTGDLTVDRMCAHRHIPLVRGRVVESRLPESRAYDYGPLMKWFLKRGDLPFQDKDHLIRAGRPVSVNTKTREVPVVHYG